MGLFEGLSKFGKALLNQVNIEMENKEEAYREGMSMDKESLIHYFENSSGFRRAGFYKAMIERGLIIKNGDKNYKNY
ncbi:MAG: hypothetical protein E7254_10740 [Lachnospiraceae bacterium]|nr:hypothetical protein [Lachnospiraceae bacterium]